MNTGLWAIEVKSPKVLVEGWRIELIDSEPSLVTPVSCRFDRLGNLFVVECHTHMPPDNYSGPKVDRIFVYHDRQPDGKFKSRQLFYEGSIKTMGLAVDKDGWVYLASRSQIIRIKDSDGDLKADVTEVLISHQTKADYPHNGLSGLTLSLDGYLYFGQGENFGEKFTIVGTDYSKQVGSGEGGSVYRCRLDGSQVERYATGIWNPFGLAFDDQHRLWCVDNDPDSRPPCRLLNIVPTGDYGFQFRFGRAGTNLLLAWDGELPGTLPMAAGTGEAPCEVIQHGQYLLVSSWGDNRVERFSLTSDGATTRGKMEVLVQGDADFRPVSFTIAPDQSIYLTDWVDRSYPVHGRGRLWRLIPPPQTDPRTIAPLSESEKLARKLAVGSAESQQYDQAIASHDPFLTTAASLGKTLHSNSPTAKPWSGKTSDERVENLRMARWNSVITGKADTASYLIDLKKALHDQEVSVRLLAIRYAAEIGDQQFLPDIESLFNNDRLAADEFHILVAANSFLRTGSASGAKRDPSRDRMLAEFFNNENKPIGLRKLALQQLPWNTKELPTSKLIAALNDERNSELRRDLLAVLSQRRDPVVMEQLELLLRSKAIDGSFRADLLASLATIPQWKEKWTDTLKSDLVTVDSNAAFQMELHRVGNSIKKLPISGPERPQRDSLDQWLQLVRAKGDSQRGWRVWARSECIKCHMMDGRGAELGPDLSSLSKSNDRRRVLQSMLQPSREVAPLFATWQILTTDGRVLVGAKLNAGGVGTNLRFLAADGTTFEVPLNEIEHQQISFKSIMPDDITDTLSVEEIGDLLEYLSPTEP